MLEGLEVSILNLSSLNQRNDRFRYDAEFSKKEYLNIENKLESKKFIRLIDTDSKIIHPSEIKREYVENGVWFFRTQNLRPLKIVNSNDVYISFKDAKTLQNNEIKIGDVLITRTGANYGQTAIYNRNLKAIGSSHVLILRNTYFNQYFLAVFFNTFYGKKLINKGMYGAAQPEIAPYYLLNIPVPIFSIDFQNKIEQLFSENTLYEKKSEDKYLQAESILLQTIGLKKFTPNTDPINVKSFKDSFLVTGRLDAEYYQKKYEEVIEHIKSQKFDTLVNLVRIKKSIEPGSDAYSDEGGLPFYRVSDYNKFGLNKPDKELKENFVAENSELIKKLKPKQGTILFSKDGSVGTAYLLRKDLDGITSGAILHLTVKDKKQIVPEYLTLVLNSKLVQMQAERDAGGSIILHWRVGEIENVVVPIIDYTKQEEIAELVEESFKLKKQSENILEVAKRAVEIAIEENEVVALKYIENANIN